VDHNVFNFTLGSAVNSLVRVFEANRCFEVIQLPHLVELNVLQNCLTFVISCLSRGTKHSGIKSEELTMPVIAGLITFNDDVSCKKHNFASHIKALVFGAS
jgi:hypothetical protein